jgi:hypothetical protein
MMRYLYGLGVGHTYFRSEEYCSDSDSEIGQHDTRHDSDEEQRQAQLLEQTAPGPGESEDGTDSDRETDETGSDPESDRDSIFDNSEDDEMRLALYDMYN